MDFTMGRIVSWFPSKVTVKCTITDRGQCFSIQSGPMFLLLGSMKQNVEDQLQCVGVSNFLVFLLSIPIMGSDMWLATRHRTSVRSS